MRISTRMAIALTLLVCLSLCKVGDSYQDNSLAENVNDINLDARDEGDDGDAAIIMCTECVQQQSIPDEDLSNAIAWCVDQTMEDPDYDCSYGDNQGQSGRELSDEGYLEERGWKFGKKIKSWFRRNRDRLRRAIRRAKCMIACRRLRDPRVRRVCIWRCLRI